MPSRSVPPRSTEKRSFVVIAAAATASVFCPWLLIRQFNSSEQACASSSADDGAALRTLALLAQRNADELRNLGRDSIEPNVLAVLERALSKSGSSSEALAAAALLQPQPQQRAARVGSVLDAAADASPSSAIWLRFAIVSIARKGNADYLLRALHSIVEELPAQRAHPIRAATDIVVVNNNKDPSAHVVFEEASRRYAHAARFVVKKALEPPLQCPRQGRGRSAPKPSVQQQSCDLVAAFGALLDVTPAAAHVMLLEDDWLLCPHGLAATNHAIDKVLLIAPDCS